MSASRPSVTTLVAAYNEAPVIGTVVREARRAVPSGEVLVVDDGSTDGTDRVAADAGARVLRLSVNGGKGAAIRRGLPEARGDVIVLIDGDGQDDPTEIPRLVEALHPDVDLVVGSRFIGKFEPGAITPVNRWGNRFLTSVINRLFAARLTDTQAGFKAFRAETLRRVNLSAHRFDIEVDLLLGILRAGGRIVEVPVRRAPRQHGASRLNSLRDGVRILRRIVALRLGAG
jgi:glycosyltransferase involved in cell wall biosynthesis